MSAAAEDSRLDPANAAADKNLRELEGGRAGESTAASSSSNIDGKGHDNAEATYVSSQRDGLVARIRSTLDDEVDPAKCTFQMSFYCFMTGWADAVAFAAAYLFVGFQTGSMVQLSAAIARLFSGPDENASYFHPEDRLALCSLLSFIAGAAFGQVGDRLGPKKRLWLVGSTALQAGLMAGSFIALRVPNVGSYADARGSTPWHVTGGYFGIGLLAASMGLQGIVAKRLNTHYGTSVVLTTIWCELAADPGLLHWRTRVPSRDHRANAILMLFLGAFIGRVLTGTIGGAATIGIGAGLKMLVAFTFYWVPSKVVKKA